MKISIVSAYHNRRDLFINTLNSILLEKYDSELEIIIIDDGSELKHNLDDINSLYPTLDIKIIKINKDKKTWINPSIPFNIGFSKATGDVIIIQNPECLHMGNVIKTIENNIKDNTYIVMGCYAINEKETEQVNNLKYDNNYLKNIKNIIKPLQNRGAFDEKSSSWYQHSMYRNQYLHFCSAIKRKDLDDLGGFDERFANGIGKDDREFVLRIQRKKMNIKVIDEPFVIHQRHEPTKYFKKNLVDINNEIYKVILNEKTYKVNNENNSFYTKL